MTWSCLIDAGKANPHGLEVLMDGDGNFRVKIHPSGMSDWITHVGGRIPVADDVKVSVRLCALGDLAGARANTINWSQVILFRVHGTPEPAEKQGGYMVSVDGHSAPTHEHDTVERAIAEAQRVGAQPANVSRTVRVLQVVATLPPVGHRTVVMAGEAA